MTTRMIGATLLLTLSLTLTSCASWFGANPTAGPTKVESAMYNTVTNYNTAVVLQTNTVTLTVTNVIVQTNQLNQVTTTLVIQTNSLQNVVTVTNLVPVYTLSENTNTATVLTVAGAAINTVIPGAGTLTTLAGTLLLGFWGWLRSGKQGNASATLAQEVETLREFIQALPNGTAYDAAIVNWLQQHQVQTGAAQTILGLLSNEVSNPDAKAAVNAIGQTLTSLNSTAPVVKATTT